MTTLDHTRIVGGRGYGSVLSGVIGRFISWNDARVTRNALWKLTDRELDDIGLSRSDIDDIR